MRDAEREASTAPDAEPTGRRRPRPGPGAGARPAARRRLGRFFGAGAAPADGQPHDALPDHFPGVPRVQPIKADPPAARPRPGPGGTGRPRT